MGEENAKRREVIMHTKWKTKAELINFLSNTLIPDLRASGTDATADDFEDAVEFMQKDTSTILHLRNKAGKLCHKVATLETERNLL